MATNLRIRYFPGITSKQLFKKSYKMNYRKITELWNFFRFDATVTKREEGRNRKYDPFGIRVYTCGKNNGKISFLNSFFSLIPSKQVIYISGHQIVDSAYKAFSGWKSHTLQTEIEIATHERTF